MVAIPRLVIAAPSSGSGKTTVACGLMAAFRGRGFTVSGHKVGPDYIDPGYHALATGRPGRNLDPFLCGEELIVPLFLHGAAGAGVAVVEGVMGLFDGLEPGEATGGPEPGDSSGAPWPGFGSTAHVARLLGAPVVLVIDASSAGRSVAAIATGFARFDPGTDVAGVILNRVGSDRHETLLRDALSAAGVPVYGAIRRSPGVAAPSRHLGLVPAAERAGAAAETAGRLAALVAESCDIGGLLALARRAPGLTGPPWDPEAALAPPWPHGSRTGTVRRPGPAGDDGSPGGAGHRPAGRERPLVAVARGPAFTFCYTEQAELLAAAGADVAGFDPLQDEELPGETAGLLLGGGFPEIHADGLSANEPLRRQVAALAARGAPVAAECGGLLYLSRSLDGLPMCGVLAADTAMTDRLTLGYRTARAEAESVVTAAGERVRAHEFHRTAAIPGSGRQAAWRLPAGGREGHVAGRVFASYLHVHWAGYPGAAARFAAACGAAVAEPAAAGRSR
ncbi:MAG TPA: cobyrinate a,c-diamide synthase [Streptosporangiaceae bacterium]|nr:cobyrinate a,c-diamide synthase [Streptosporangiaceae bacterium]